jgi:hypothetical protein
MLGVDGTSGRPLICWAHPSWAASSTASHPSDSSWVNLVGKLFFSDHEGRFDDPLGRDLPSGAPLLWKPLYREPHIRLFDPDPSGNLLPPCDPSSNSSLRRDLSGGVATLFECYQTMHFLFFLWSDVLDVVVICSLRLSLPSVLVHTRCCSLPAELSSPKLSSLVPFPVPVLLRRAGHLPCGGWI